MKSPILKEIRLELTQDAFVVVVANDLEEGFELIKSNYSVLKHYKFPEEHNDCEAICWPQTFDFGVAVIFKFKNLQASYIVHEVTHATYAILKSIGLALNDGTDEVFAYHNDMLFRLCIAFMKENKLKVKI